MGRRCYELWLLLGVLACGREHPPLSDLDGSSGGGGRPGKVVGGGGGKGGEAAGAGASGTDCVAPYPNGFCVGSPQGVTYGGTKLLTIASQDSVFNARGNSAIELTAQDPDHGRWTIQLASANDDYFVPGDYFGATPYPYNSFGIPGFGIQGDDEDGGSLECSLLFADFTVSELGRDQYGGFTSAAVSFSASCGVREVDRILTGQMHYRASGVAEPPPEDPGDCAVTTPLGFCYRSQLGHPVGLGRQVTLDPKMATFSVTSSGAGLVAVDITSGDFLYSAQFGGPKGRALVPGHYAGAVPASKTAPQFLNPGCATPYASFDVLAVEYGDPAVVGAGGAGGAETGAGGASGASTELARLDLDFSYSCEPTRKELRGKLRFRAP